ncbi:MAG: hypothetical protein WHU54_02190 [Candidatus Bathyarchaeia archaeon]
MQEAPGLCNYFRKRFVTFPATSSECYRSCYLRGVLREKTVAEDPQVKSFYNIVAFSIAWV